MDCSKGSLRNAARVIKGLERSESHEGYCDRSSATGGDSELLKISRPRNGVLGFIAKRVGRVAVEIRLLVVLPKRNILLILEFIASSPLDQIYVPLPLAPVKRMQLTRNHVVERLPKRPVPNVPQKCCFAAYYFDKN